MENNITMEDCKALYQHFIKYTETAEQHEFLRLAKIHFMLDSTLSKWSDPINQKEARAMFRIVLGHTGGDIAPYLEKEN